MFRSITATMGRDRDYPARQFTLDVYGRVLNGALYDHMPHGFHQEKTENGDYVPLRDRRPGVRYNLCRLVVEDSVSLLFSEGHFPTPKSEDAATGAAAQALIKHGRLNAVMLEAATIGSVGSAAVQMQVLKAAEGDGYRVFFKPFSTEFLTPRFSPQDPDRLAGIREQYKVKGADLAASGYGVAQDDLAEDFWFAREWDAVCETWITPWKVCDGDAGAGRVDEARSVRHDLGFVPWVWIRNLPGRLKLLPMGGGFGGGGAAGYSDIDGACTFEAAVETMIEIEYQLSQAGRGLKYSMDPTLLLKEPARDLGEFVKSPANALVVDAGGDAKMLEIGGSAFSVVLDYVRALREFALEAAHGSRADASRLSAAQSGRAMELMNQALIWLADRLRVSYGEGALLSLLRMALKAHETFPLVVGGEVLALERAGGLSLSWPAWHMPTSRDLQEQATTVVALTAAGVMSKETAVRTIAGNYDVEDVVGELQRVG